MNHPITLFSVSPRREAARRLSTVIPRQHLKQHLCAIFRDASSPRPISVSASCSHLSLSRSHKNWEMGCTIASKNQQLANPSPCGNWLSEVLMPINTVLPLALPPWWKEARGNTDVQHVIAWLSCALRTRSHMTETLSSSPRRSGSGAKG